MRVGILGSGLIGGKLGMLLAHAGHEVTFSYARSMVKLEVLAKEVGNGSLAGTPLEAARDADVVLLAVHWSRVDDVLSLAGDLVGKTVITCSLPMTDDDSALAVGHSSSGAENLPTRFRARISYLLSAAPQARCYPRCSIPRAARRGLP